MSKEVRLDSLLRLSQVLELIPVSKSCWWAGCANGRFPKPYKLSPGVTVWFASDIYRLIDDLEQEDGDE